MFERLHIHMGMIMNLVTSIFTCAIMGWVMITIMGTLSQELSNANNCGENITNLTETIPIEKPTGPTDSFGGGGAKPHFGGYDGTVVHKSWLEQRAIVKTDKTFFLTKNCDASAQLSNVTSSMSSFANIYPMMMVLIIICMLCGILIPFFRLFRDVGGI